MNGHWFCDACESVVFPRHITRAAGAGMIKCPECGHPTAHYVLDAPRKRAIKPEVEEMPATNRVPVLDAASRFAQMRKELGL